MSYNITTVMRRLDGSIGESKATFADGGVTFENSETPSPYMLTAGAGISIENGVISVNYANADEEAF